MRGGMAVTAWVIWGVVALGVGGVILRPWGVREVVPALAGALALVVFGLLPVGAALRGVAQGTDVYLFLTGMMILAELAADQGLFAWAAGWVAQRAGGSAARLFAMIYGMAVVITAFLSNDATAVVFTPAVAAMARAVEAKQPLPFLLICAFVANAASFVLPISNPANLVVYGAALPPLLGWVRQFGLASVVAIGATFLLLRFTQRRALAQPIMAQAHRPELSAGGRHAGLGIAGTAVVLMGASAWGVPLGLPTLLCGLGTAAVVLLPARLAPWPMVKNISWDVLPLVAGLFVMVAALDRTGLVGALAAALRQAGGAAGWRAGLGLGVLVNLVNNLPAGLLAGHALAQAQLAPQVSAAALVGIDLGPNLSVTGSLATILWLTALRRAGLHVSAWQFLRIGLVVMPLALLATVAVVALYP
ncbi:arsenic transporter [Acidocella aquatica]|uniref:Arsenic transporter n=2 Tax=Acidocella aquatica TaxID=1922313 RepID=A0ABQ6A6N7_9PROT|nr:arsenic transporter [Acidocella aquatica]